MATTTWDNVGRLDPAWSLPETCVSITTHASWNYFVGCYAGKCDRKCYPPLETRVTNIFTYFSPAVCPTGYSSACKAQGTPSNLFVCCPTGFTCNTGWDCAKNPFTNGVATFWSAPSDWPTVIPTSFPLTTTGSSPEFAIVNLGIIVMSGGSQATTTGPSSAGSTSTTTGAGTPPASNPPNESSPRVGGLSRDAVIAIAVTIPIIVVLLFVGVFAFVRRRRADAGGEGKPERAKRAFLPHFGRSELPAHPEEPPAEADSRQVPGVPGGGKAKTAYPEEPPVEADSRQVPLVPGGGQARVDFEGAAPVYRDEVHELHG